MGCTHQGIPEDKRSAVLHPQNGQGICGTVVCEGAGISRARGQRKGVGRTMLPEITVTQLAEKLNSENQFILLDVREPHEVNLAKVSDSRLEVPPIFSSKRILPVNLLMSKFVPMAYSPR